jgi:hypothetical protein
MRLLIHPGEVALAPYPHAVGTFIQGLVSTPLGQPITELRHVDAVEGEDDADSRM